MRTLLVTDGTKESLRAMVALGCGLLKRGHKPVYVACPRRFRELVEEHGLRWTLFDPPRDQGSSGEGGLSFAGTAEALERVCKREGIDQTRDSTATQQRNCIVCEHATLHAAYSLAEKFAICWVGFFFAPISPTSDHPSTALWLLPPSSWSWSWPWSAPLARLRLANRCTHLIDLAVEWRRGKLGARVNAWRRNRLQLPAITNALGVMPLIKRQTLPIIHPLHPSFYPKPQDWPAELKVPGFIFMPDKPSPVPFLSSDLRLELAARSSQQTSAQPASLVEGDDDDGCNDEHEGERKEARRIAEEEEKHGLQRFLGEDGDGTGADAGNDSVKRTQRPIFFACGHQQANVKSILNIATQLAERAQRRVILFVRDEDGPPKRSSVDDLVDVDPAWTDELRSTRVPESLFVVSRISYTSILRKCGCAIIDGGHAITAMCIRYGVPLVFLPRDERVSWFWANRALEVGISPPPIPSSNLNVDALLRAIDEATSRDTLTKLERMHKLVNADGDGIQKVVDAFERVCITSIGLVPTSYHANLSNMVAVFQDFSLKDAVSALAFLLFIFFWCWLFLQL